MTANYVDHLDKALVRPGRVDLISHLTLCTPSTICEIVQHFFNNTFTTDEKNIIMAFDYCGMTPAEVTQVLFEHHSDFNTAFSKLVAAITRKQPVNDTDTLPSIEPMTSKLPVDGVPSINEWVGNNSPDASSDWSAEN